MKRIITILIFLISGLIIYWLFSPGIYLFKWTGFNNKELNIPTSIISILIKNYLPDLLWAAAVNNTAILMAEKKIDAVYIYSLIALPFISETLQRLSFIPGTFDWYDLLIYFIIFLYYFKFKIYQLCKKSGFLLDRSSC